MVAKLLKKIFHFFENEERLHTLLTTSIQATEFYFSKHKRTQIIKLELQLLVSTYFDFLIAVFSTICTDNAYTSSLKLFY